MHEAAQWLLRKHLTHVYCELEKFIALAVLLWRRSQLSNYQDLTLVMGSICRHAATFNKEI